MKIVSISLAGLMILVGVLCWWIVSHHGSHALSQPVAEATSSQAIPLVSSDSMSVEGNRLLYDGRPFVPEGVQIVAFANTDPQNVFLQAKEHFGAPLLQAARLWNANTIRFQFSQDGLDPQNPRYSQAYINAILGAVSLARKMGFVVIASVQNEVDPDKFGFPTAATQRADLTLARLFGGDDGVMLDLFNEPGFGLGLKVNAQLWQSWLSGGVIQGTQTVGMQTLVHAVRAQGSHNVLILEGLISFQPQTLAGVPVVDDPLSLYAYATHPYLQPGFGTPQSWEQNFGYLANENRLVIADEWSAPTALNGAPEHWCKSLSLGVPADLLAFLGQKNIGVVGWSFDIPGTIVTDFNGTPTSYTGMVCGSVNGGPGELLQQHFAAAMHSGS